MSLQGKKTPLGVNTLTGLLSSSGLTINKTAAGYMGASNAVGNYTKGSITTLNLVSDILRLAYPLITAGTVSQATYDSLLALGSTSIPALGNSKPSTYTPAYTGEATSYGWLRMIPWQAYSEFVFAGGTYNDFLQSFARCVAYRDQNNRNICTLVNSKTFLDGIYSNMNDLTTADITGVTVSTLYWGQDLIASGKCIDLASLTTFGKPSNLLKTMDKYHAITAAVGIALITAEFTASEVNDLINGKLIPTHEHEQKLYSAYKLVRNADLKEALIPLNVQTANLDSLADLLNPQKLFPKSYSTLTVPKYNITNSPTNSKIYYLIYTGEGINSQLSGMNFGKELKGILPDNIAIACEALRFSMLQVKNITRMSVEKFSQVVTNLETTNGLTNIGGTTKPTGSVDSALALLAKGSGTSGQYTMNDFFGSMSGIPYDFAKLNTYITTLQSAALTTCYNSMLTELRLTQDHNTPLQTLINTANTEILRIKNANPATATAINDLWNGFGKQLSIEKAARAIALAGDSVATVSDTLAFSESMDTYSVDTGYGQAADTLEAISDTNTTGGQSLIGSMREVRNAKRLGLAGGVLDNDIPDTIVAAPVNGLGIPKITGAAKAPGSFAGSPETSLIPQNLDIFNISNNLSPSVIKPADAIAHVITCNCDCWDDILSL